MNYEDNDVYQVSYNLRDESTDSNWRHPVIREPKSSRGRVRDLLYPDASTE